ncbi:SpoIIE family protein phosphatase [Sulfobacillus sp. DSM 109850]|uniref:SpoIIE family protein phosphatase n=1 Tax=Sulfobacillus harzensis TaxID=2729629 RepID=A0A7Y0Q2T3_9FIRM|nr:SpoIIE family protein phosphatase [Sulfobacillus harzensis]
MGVGVAGAIFGQAMLYHHAAPFVAIFSLMVWPKRRHWYAPLMLGGLAGTLLAAGWLSAVVLLAWGLVVPLPWYRPGWQFLRWPLLALGAAGLFLAGHAGTSYTLIVAALVAAGSILLFFLLSRELERVLVGDVDRRTLVLALASLGCLIAGLAGYQIFDVNPSLFFGALVMLSATAIQGPAGGAVAGATLGVTLALRGGSADVMVGILVAGGFLAGWLGTKHWRWASVGLVAGVLLYAVFIQMPSPLKPFWVSMAGAAAVFQAVPDSVIAIARRWAESFAGVNARDLLGERMTKIADVMREMARAFRVDEEIQAPETQLVQSVVESVCKKCSLYRSCWEDEFYRSYRGLMDLSAKAEDAVVTDEDLEGDLARRCIRPDAVAHATNLAMNREKERANFALRIKESRALAELQLTGLAQLVAEMAQDVQATPTVKRRRWRVEPLGYRVGVAKRPRRGGVISGDSELICDLSPTRVVFGISDGMGVGPRAAWESGAAMSLLEQLLMAGFSQPLAVRAVNSTLLLRSVDDHFATLDLLLLDQEARQMEIVKVAASPTFIRRRGHVFEVRGHSLPVGIVQDVAIDPITQPVEPGDVVVMVTDGVMEDDQRSGEARLKRFLEQMPVGDPEMMAEALLSFMLGDSQDGRDDALVMVIVIGAPSSVAPYAEQADNGAVPEWQRITPISLRRG